MRWLRKFFNSPFHTHCFLQMRLMSHKKYAKAKFEPSGLDLLESTVNELEMEQTLLSTDQSEKQQ